MTYNVKSYDDGFGDNKIYDGKEALINPAFVTRWQPMPEGEFSKNLYSDPYSHITVEYDGKKQLIGEGAKLVDKKGNWNGEKNKHKSRKFPPMLKGNLALLCKDDMEREVHINPLVMGLPHEDYTNARREELKKLVIGKHEVKVTLADGTIIDKEIHVDDLITLSQPLGSFFYVALDKDGNIKDELLTKKTTVVFDLGARTLNVLTLKGFTPLPGLSFQESLGVFSAWDDIQKQIKIEHDKDIPLIRIPDYCADGYISDNIDIRDLRDEIYADHTDTLLSVFGSEFISNIDEVDQILLTGGGSEVLKRNLEAAFRDRFPKAKIIPLSRTATVQGYNNYGVRVSRNKANKSKKPLVTASKENKQ